MLTNEEQFLSYLKIKKATIFCLQETYSSPEDENCGL